MTSIILYGSPKKLTNAHKPVHHASTPPPPAQPQPEYFVRVKVHRGDVDSAMMAARPQEGEILLNTVQLDEPPTP